MHEGELHVRVVLEPALDEIGGSPALVRVEEGECGPSRIRVEDLQLLVPRGRVVCTYPDLSHARGREGVELAEESSETTGELEAVCARQVRVDARPGQLPIAHRTQAVVGRELGARDGHRQPIGDLPEERRFGNHVRLDVRAPGNPDDPLPTDVEDQAVETRLDERDRSIREVGKALEEDLSRIQERTACRVTR